MACVSAACLRQRWRQLAVAAVLVAVLGWVVADSLQKGCTAVESEGERVQRLFCDGLLNATTDDRVVPGQPFTCGDPDSDDPWVSDGGSPPQCQQAASCLSVGFDSVLEWIGDHPELGWVVTATVYALLTVLVIPGSVLTIGSGVAFGSALGLGKGVVVAATAVLVGADAGATMAFLLGRFLFRDLVANWAAKYRVIKAIDISLHEKGLQVMLLLRLSPVVPFNVFNFIAGSTSVSLRDYVIGTVVGIIPGTFAFVFIGALVGSAAFDRSADALDGTTVLPETCEDDPKAKTIRSVIVIVGSIATVLAVVIITFYARRQFQRISEEAEDHAHTELEAQSAAAEGAPGVDHEGSNGGDDDDDYSGDDQGEAPAAARSAGTSDAKVEDALSAKHDDEDEDEDEDTDSVRAVEVAVATEDDAKSQASEEDSGANAGAAAGEADSEDERSETAVAPTTL